MIWWSSQDKADKGPGKAHDKARRPVTDRVDTTLDSALRAREPAAAISGDQSRICSLKDTLLEYVWGYREAPLTRTVDVTILRLRQKIEINPRNPQFVATVPGLGYRFKG